MIDKAPKNTPNDLLRARAEKLLDKLERTGQADHTDIKSLIHELQIHQVELEVRNEELQQIQLDLEEARDQYRELYDHAPVAYLNLSQQDVILKANLKAAELLASHSRNLVGNSLVDYIAAESQDDFYLHQQAVFCSGKKHSVEVILRREPRTVIRIESICGIVQDSSLLQSHTVLFDLTIEKAAAKALVEVNHLLAEKVSERNQELAIRLDERAAILNTVTDAIITIDDNGIIDAVNYAAGDMFGYTEAELVGSPVSMLMPEPHASAHHQYIRRYMASGHSHILGRTTDMVGKRKDQSLFPLSLSVNRIDDELRFIGIMRDMTQRVTLEYEVLQSIEIERNRISRELHDNVSQVLVGMAMQTQSLMNSIKKNGSDGFVEALSALGSGLKDAAKDVTAVVKDLAGLQLEENTLEDYFITLVDNCNAYSQPTIVLDWQEGLQLKNQQIGTQLFRIAQEALHNAIRHANASKIQVSISEHSGGTLTLKIADNGIGSVLLSQQHPSQQKAAGFGVNNMKYRAHIIGATLTIDTGSNGTTVRCLLPASKR